MENQKAPAPIEHLPTEIMCNIFDYLDTSSVKKCSLVCRRWKEIIFSDHYIQRFQFSFTGRNVSYMFDKPRFSMTDRLYRHLKLDLVNRDFDIVYNLLQYPNLKQYITLELQDLAPENLMMMTSAVKQMGELRELCVTYFKSTKIRYHIRSISLQLLRLDNTLPFFISTPNLNTLKMKTDQQITPVERLFSYRFPNLKHLEIESQIQWQTKNVDRVIRFFSQLKGLETLVFSEGYVYGYIFKAICECCPNLDKLHIKKMCIVDVSIIKHLSNLTKLTELILEQIQCITPVSFLNVNLPRLATLGIGHFRMQYETLEAFRSVTKLKIFHQLHSPQLISAIARNMPLVREIEFVTFVFSDFLELPSSVEVVVFRKQYLQNLKYSLKHPMSNIREIYFTSSYAYTTNADIAGLLERLPNLQLLKTEDKIVFKNV